jgi:hypothetical protein
MDAMMAAFRVRLAAGFADKAVAEPVKIFV